MASKTKIQWTEETWNPIAGCTKCSPGCLNCYAERMAARLAAMYRKDNKKYKHLYKYHRAVWCSTGRWRGEVFCDEKSLDKPLHWRKPRKVFVNSMSDTFHEKVPFEFIDKVIAITTLRPEHTFQILTKRAGRMLEYYTESKPVRGMYLETDVRVRIWRRQAEVWHGNQELHSRSQWNGKWPMPNTWLGVTVCNPDEKPKIDILRQIPAAVRFISFEPLLADMGELNLDCISWVIVGCESGPKRRLCKHQWALRIVKQCKAANVPCFVKQLQENDSGKNKVIKMPRSWPQEYPKE